MKISLITATYNSEKTIEQTIKSIIAQSYPNIEHIVIDGGSSDETLSIISKYKEYISHVVSESDKGIYDALNKGIKCATGDVIGFLNSDDILADSNVLERVAKAFQNQNIDMVFGDLTYQKRNDYEVKTVRTWKSNTFKSKDLKYGWMPPHPTLYCRQHVYNECGLYNDTFKISADYEFILRAFKHNKYNTLYIPHTLVNMSTGGISNGSLKGIIRKSREDYEALRLNNVGSIFTLIFKNLRKINQFRKHE